MVNLKLISIIKKMPQPVQTFSKYTYSILPFNFRYGKEFIDYYNFLQDSQYWSRELLEEYQLNELNKLLNHSYQSVPYYKRIFDENGLKPNDIQDFKDLNLLPCLTKEDFKENFKDLVSVNIKTNNLPLNSTSGTTGRPLQFFTSLAIERKELASIFHQWNRVGYGIKDSRIGIRGDVINKEDQVNYDPIFNVLRFSPQINNLKTVRNYLKRMTKFKSSFIHGYPSSIAYFAFIIKENNLKVPFQLKSVFFVSEAVYDWQREIVEEVFNCRAFSHYGMAEKVALASECEGSSDYHFMPQYGITEIDPKTNEIIATGFLNYITPFIRYKTTDIASKPSSYCGYCDREYYPIVKNIEGRIEDYILTGKGLIGPAAMTHPFKDIKFIKDTQIVQTSMDHIILKIYPWKLQSKDYGSELELLLKRLKKIVGENVIIEVEEKDDSKKSNSGKFKWITSEVSKDMIREGFK